MKNLRDFRKYLAVFLTITMLMSVVTPGVVAQGSEDIMSEDPFADGETSDFSVTADEGGASAEVVINEKAEANYEYEKEANKLNELGLYKGVSDSKFDPDLGATLDRQTAVIMVLRLFAQEEAALKLTMKEAEKELSKFEDADEIADWAKRQVAYATSKEMVKGYEEGGKTTFKATKLVTDKEYCTLILKNLGYEGFEFTKAPEYLGKAEGLKESDVKSYSKDRAITKDAMVNISYQGLLAKYESGDKTVIEKLVEEKAVDQKVAEEQFPDVVKSGLEIVSATANNGQIKAVVKAELKETPKNEEVKLTQAINGGEAKSVAGTVYGYEAATKTVVINFPVIPATATEQKVKFGINIKDSKTFETEMTIAAATAFPITSATAVDSATVEVKLGAVPATALTTTNFSLSGGVVSAVNKVNDATYRLTVTTMTSGTSYTLNGVSPLSGSAAFTYAVGAGAVSVTTEFTPSRSIAMSQALVEVANVKISATANSTINGIKLNRSGLSADRDITSVTVWDGTVRLNTASIFSNNVADITFTNPLEIKAGESKTLAVKLNVAARGTATNAAQIILSLVDINAIKVPAGTVVNGTFPMTSNVFTLAEVNLGTMTIALSADRPTTTLDAGVNNVRLAKFDFTANTEDQKLKSITFTQNGAAADSDITNLKLFNGATQLGSTVTLVNRKATFVVDLDITAGTTIRLDIKGDVVGGAGRNVQFDVADVNDVQSTGKTYGTTIVANVTVQGQLLNVNTGSFLISRDSSSAVSGAVNFDVDDQNFTTIKVEAVGEPIQLRAMRVVTTVGGGAMPSDLTDLKIMYNNTTVAQLQTPFTSTVVNGVEDELINLTTPVNVVPGTPALFKLTADFRGSAAGETYLLGVRGGVNGQTLEGVGNVSGLNITVANSTAVQDISGNVMTVGNLSVNVIRVPKTNGNVFRSESGKKLVEFDINHNLSETVNVSTLGVLFTGSAGIPSNDFSNARLVDVSGNVLTEVVVRPDAATTLTFKNPLVVEAGKTIRVGLVVDVLSTAVLGRTYTFGIQNTSVARTADTGTSIVVNALTVGNPVMTVNAGGVTLGVVASSKADVGDGSIFRGMKDKKVAQFTFTNTGSEVALVKKVRLSPNYGPVANPLTGDHVTNIRLVNGAGTVLATLQTLGAETLVSLTTPLEIAGNSAIDNTAELGIIVDIDSSAQYNGTMSIALGDGPVTATNLVDDADMEVQTKSTGVTDSTLQVLAGGVSTSIVDATFRVSVSKVTLTNKAVSDSTPVRGNGVEIGRFTIKNEGSEAVVLEQLRIDDLRSTTGLTTRNATTATVRLMSVSDGKFISNAQVYTGDSVNIVLIPDGTINGLRINSGSVQDISIQIENQTTAGLQAGDASMIRVVDSGTLFDTIDNSIALVTGGYEVDNSVTCDNITFE